MAYPKGQKWTPEQRQRLSAACKARGFGSWMKGRKMSKKNKEALAAASRTPEERARRSQRAKAGGYGKWMKGRKACEATRQALLATARKTFDEKYGPRADEIKRKISESNKRAKPRTKIDRPLHHGDESAYSHWRRAVFKRDGYTCQHCSARGTLQAHHIKSWSKFPALRYEVSNGITLCVPCHREANREQRIREKAIA